MMLFYRYLHFHRFTTIFVHQVVRTNGYFSDIFGNFHSGKAAGKRLLVDMGMGKDAGTQNRLVRSNDLPLVRKVLPALIRVASRNVKLIGITGGAPDLHLDDICFPCISCRTHKKQAGKKNMNQFHGLSLS